MNKVTSFCGIRLIFAEETLTTSDLLGLALPLLLHLDFSPQLDTFYSSFLLTYPSDANLLCKKGNLQRAL